MSRRKAHPPLNVFVNARHAGVLRRASTGAIDFRYAEEWLAWSATFPLSLSLPLREDRYIGEPVINVFENLLPDSQPIRTRVAERVGAQGTDAYSLLSALGHDCVGALQFMPEGMDPGPPGKVDAVPLSDNEVSDIINNLATAPLGMGEDEGFRISIAGAQEKTALLRMNGRWFKPIGTTATTHILKPQIGRLPNGVDLSNSVENEYFCLKLLAAFGVPTPAIEIADFGQRRTLIVERFDRRWTRDARLLRLPQEDMCQALSVPPTHKYQSDGGPGMRDIIQLLKGSDRPEEDIMTFMRGCVLFWLLGATDGHAKNFSVFLGPGGRYSMTPLYDVLSGQPSLDSGEIQRKQFRMAMSVGSKRHYAIEQIMPRHFLQTADVAGIDFFAVQSLFEELYESGDKPFDVVIDALPGDFPDDLVSAVRGAFQKRLSLLLTPADGDADAAIDAAL